MINEESLEKFCIDKINIMGKLLRVEPENKYFNGKFDAYSQVLALIAQEKTYEDTEDQDQEDQEPRYDRNDMD